MKSEKIINKGKKVKIRNSAILYFSLFIFHFSLCIFVNAQNNAIFYGGNADGFIAGSYTQPDVAVNNSIFIGGNADGLSINSYIQPDVASNNTVFYGGNADGFSLFSYTQPDVASNNTVFYGGNADGFSLFSYTQPDVASNNTVFYGGNADGFSLLSYIQPDVASNNTVFYGGNADGFSLFSYTQPDVASNNTVFYGGNADGFSLLSYTQPDVASNNNVFYGGNADGFSLLSYTQPDVASNNTVFYGGNADGFSLLSYTQPDVASNNTVFFGGNADGFGNAANSSSTAYIWNVASGNWATPASWLPSRTTSASGDILIFDGAIQATPVVTLNFGASAIIGKLSFINNVAPAFSNSVTQTLTMNQSGLASNSFTFLGENNSTYSFNVENTSTVDLTGVTNLTLNLPTSTDTLNIDLGSMLNMTNSNQVTGTGSSGYVKIKGTFKTNDPDGFSGTANTSVANTITGINLSTASTIEYNAAGAQTVSSRSDYQNITFSGSGTKTLNGNIDVDKILTIEGTAGLDVNGSDINIAGDWVNNSANATPFTAGTRTVTFDGTTNIVGTAITTFYNVTISNTKTLNIPSQKAITIENTFTNDGTVLIDGAPNGYSGSLITNGTVTGSGTFSYKTSITKNKWHCLSSPITNAQIETVFSDLASHNNNFYRYDETSASSFWVQQTTGTMNPGQGYNTYYFGNKYKTYSGIYNSGNININITYSAGGRQGWNFVGNPYPSAIDWKAASGWTRDNVDNTICIKNNQNWAFYNYFTDIGINGGTRYIYPGQGFFVKATASTTLSMTNAVRVHRPADNLLKSGEIISKLRFKISSDSLSNESVFMLYDESTLGHDPITDAYIMHTENEFVPELAFVSIPGDSLVMEAIPALSLPVSIPLHVKATVGINTIQLTSLEDFPDSVSVNIQDTQNGNLQDLRSDMTFNFTTGTTGNQNGRFNLLLGLTGTSLPVIITSEIWIGNPYMDNNFLYIPHKNITDKFQLNIFSDEGKEINNYKYSSDKNLISISLSESIVNGLYLLSITDKNIKINKKFILIR